MRVSFGSVPFRYSTIKSVLDTHPKKISTTWAQVVESLKRPNIQPKKGGAAWIPAIFDGTREDSNVVKVTAFFCDFDNKEGNVVNERFIKDRLKGIRYAAHTSYSHKTTHEKWRVLIPLDKEVSGNHYYWMFLYFRKLFENQLDESKKAPSHLYFKPSTPDPKTYRWHAREGRPFQFRDTGIPYRWPQVFASNEKIRSRWAGDTNGLNDKSRSGLLHSFISLATAEKFTREEIEAILEYWPHGRAKKRDLALSFDKIKPDSFDVQIVPLDTVERKRVDWLWYPYIPLGKITLLSGDPSVGKSYIGLSIATHLSRGDPLPGAKRPLEGVSLIVSAEDDLSDTIGPRLDAMHANSARILALRGDLVLGDAGFELMTQIVEEVRPTFIFIDPLSAFIDASTDTNKENAVRHLLVQLQHVAETANCSIVVIRHLTKGTRDKAMYRGQGSIAFTAAVRSELMAGWADGQRILAHAKHNVGPAGPTLSYTLDLDKDHGIPHLVWGGEVDMTVEDLNRPPEKDDKKAGDKAQNFLEDVLADGPVEADVIADIAAKEGIKERTLKRMKAQLNVQSKRRPDGKWEWSLPERKK